MKAATPRSERCQSAPPTMATTVAEDFSPPPPCERSSSAPPAFEGMKIIAARVPGASLSSLPSELRAMIFEYVLVVPQNIKVLPSSFEGEKLKTPADQTSESTDNLAALLRVNKQTLAETRGILYGRNTFHFSTGIVEGLNSSALTDFINSVAKADLACIQHIVLSPYLPRGDWSVRRRGTDFELEGMARVVRQLARVDEVEIDLDGPYGPPARRCSAVVMKRKSVNLRKVARVARILTKGGRMGVTLRAGRWLDLEFIKGQLERM